MRAATGPTPASSTPSSCKRRGEKTREGKGLSVARTEVEVIPDNQRDVPDSDGERRDRCRVTGSKRRIG